MLLLELF
jgi:hypothetical protein